MKVVPVAVLRERQHRPLVHARSEGHGLIVVISSVAPPDPCFEEPVDVPSSTAEGLPTSYSVRRSLTIWWGCRTRTASGCPGGAASPLRASSSARSSCRLRSSSLA